MTSTLRALAIAATFSTVASMASAVVTTPFATPLSAGDNTFGNAKADPGASFGLTALTFTAATPLRAAVSFTINPFLTDLSGNPANSISLAYSINGGAFNALAVTAVPVGSFGTIGAGETSILAEAGDVVSFFISGTAGQSGNQVTFAIETSEVPIAPAGALALTGVGALAAARRARKNKA